MFLYKVILMRRFCYFKLEELFIFSCNFSSAANASISTATHVRRRAALFIRIKINNG